MLSNYNILWSLSHMTYCGTEAWTIKTWKLYQRYSERGSKEESKASLNQPLDQSRYFSWQSFPKQSCSWKHIKQNELFTSISKISKEELKNKTKCFPTLNEAKHHGASATPHLVKYKKSNDLHLTLMNAKLIKQTPRCYIFNSYHTF